MKVKTVLTLHLLTILLGFSAEKVIHLWNHHDTDGQSYQCYIERSRVHTLRVVDILNENPALSLKDAAPAGLKEAKKRNPAYVDAEAAVEKVTFHVKSISSIKFSHYKVSVVFTKSGSEIGREWVDILLDGKAIPMVTLEKWKEMENEG